MILYLSASADPFFITLLGLHRPEKGALRPIPFRSRALVSRTAQSNKVPVGRMTQVSTSYDVDLNGIIIRVDVRQWERFALDNGAPAIAEPASVLGKPLAGLIAGPARDLFEVMLSAARNGQFEACRYRFRCDAPHRDRELEMRVEPLIDGDEVTGLRFTSIVLWERGRIGSVLLSTSADRRAVGPLLRMCSYCKDVEHASDGWISPRDYESRGYPTDVAITHGVCPKCNDTYVQPIITKLGN
jgi:hypothetical protein